MKITIEKKYVDSSPTITVEAPETLIENCPVILLFGMNKHDIKEVLQFCGKYAKIGKAGEIKIDINLFIISFI